MHFTARALVVAVALCLSACFPLTVDHGTLYPAALLPPLLPSPHMTEEQTPEEAAAEEAKRQNENEQARLTGARLEREHQMALRTGTAHDDEPAGVVDPFAPEDLDASMITAGIDTVRAQVMACRIQGVAGPVVAHMKIASDGAVRVITLERYPDRELAHCVAEQLQHASFASTRRGGSFRYPFVF